MEFRNIWIMLLFPPVIFSVIFFIQKRRKRIAFRFPSIRLCYGIKNSIRLKNKYIIEILRWMILMLFIIALAGPRTVLEKTKYKTEGIDIVLAIDSSGSMQAEDFTINGRRINRLDIVKLVVKDFIERRNNDNIALVTFAGLAYTVCPLTNDYSWLEANLDRIDIGLIKDGTAIGSAIMASVDRLKKSKAKSKVIILLTDGMNNAGKISPIAAAEAAKAFGIRIYTIGAGSKGYVPFPVIDPWGRKVYQNVIIDLDEDTLKKIADITGGRYFKATDTKSLMDIYKEIDSLEKTEIERTGYREYKELFDRVVAVALCLLMIELFLMNTVFLKVP